MFLRRRRQTVCAGGGRGSCGGRHGRGAFHRSSAGQIKPKCEARISVDLSCDVQETAGKVCCRRSPPPPAQRKARHERGRSLQFSSVASALSVLRTQSLGRCPRGRRQQRRVSTSALGLVFLILEGNFCLMRLLSAANWAKRWCSTVCRRLILVQWSE